MLQLQLAIRSIGVGVTWEPGAVTVVHCRGEDPREEQRGAPEHRVDQRHLRLHRLHAEDTPHHDGVGERMEGEEEG